MDAPSCCYGRKFPLPEKQTTRWRFPELSRMRRGPMIRRKSLAVAALVLPVLSLSAAEAKITAIFTITDFKSADPGGSSTIIQSVSGYWTEGTTAADNSSNVIVVEARFGGTVTYTLTGPKNGPGWTITSQYFSPATATFAINSSGPGSVSTGVQVSITEALFHDAGTVTIIEKSISSTPVPSSWQ
jgi:hypothetical protein